MPLRLIDALLEQRALQGLRVSAVEETTIETKAGGDAMSKRDLFWMSVFAISLVLLAVCASKASAAEPIGGCPKPIHHHKHHAAEGGLRAPESQTECSCVLDASPRNIILQADPPDPEPIAIPFYRYYTILSFDDPAPIEWSWAPEPWPLDGYANPQPHNSVTQIRGGRFPALRPPAQEVPEIDVSDGYTAVTILSLFILIVLDRRPPV